MKQVLPALVTMSLVLLYAILGDYFGRHPGRHRRLRPRR